MKYNPSDKTLYTNDGEFIKKLHCPYTSLTWDNLTRIDGSLDRLCGVCEKNVMETKNMSDKSLLALLQDNPDTCLKIDFKQENIRIVHYV